MKKLLEITMITMPMAIVKVLQKSFDQIGLQPCAWGKRSVTSRCHCVSWGNAPSRETQLFSWTCSPKGVKTHATLSPERLPENARESWTRTKKVVFNFARSVTLWAIEISPPITSTSNMGTCVSESLRTTGRCDRRHLKYCQLPRLKEENFLSLTSAIKCSI